jgi:hypothetical protein
LLWLNSSLNGVAGTVKTNTLATGIELVYTLEGVCSLWIGGVAGLVRTKRLRTEIGLLYTLESVSAREESECCWCEASSYKYY